MKKAALWILGLLVALPAFRAVIVANPATRDAINGLTLEKYGWRERVLRAVMMDPAGAQPIRLEPR